MNFHWGKILIFQSEIFFKVRKMIFHSSKIFRFLINQIRFYLPQRKLISLPWGKLRSGKIAPVQAIRTPV